MEYRAEIDGLRALAVLPVMLFHAGFELFSGGYVGVDVFFVISGYLISSILMKELGSGRFSIVSFYERRARRILPALFLVSFLCIPLGWIWLTPTIFKDFGESLFAVATFSSNILFWLESGYFGTTASLKPLIHTWSLAVEEQYYIFFPLLMFMIWNYSRRWMLLVFILLALTSLAIAHIGAYTYPNATFYLLHARFWELLAGGIIALQLGKHGFCKSRWVNQCSSMLGLALVLVSVLFLDDSTPFPSAYTLLPVTGTCLLILGAIPGTLVYQVLSNGFLVLIGLISYSAYLWHQPLIAFARHRSLESPSPLFLLLLCILSLGIAWLSWKFVEMPFRDRKRLKRSTIMGFSLGGILVLGSTGLAIHLADGRPDRAGFSDELVATFQRPDFGDCFSLPFNHEREEWGCYLGAEKSNVDYVLFGDSHTISLKGIIDRVAKENKQSVFYTGASGCLPFIGIYPDRNDQFENNCKLLNDRVLAFSEAKSLKGLILAARWSYYTFGDYENKGIQFVSESPDGPFDRNTSMLAFANALEQTISAYDAINVPLHIVSQSPQQYVEPEKAYFFIGKGFGTINSVSVTREDFLELESYPKELFLQHSGSIHYHYIGDEFCEAKICAIGTGAESFYFDDDHLSNAGAINIESVIARIFSSQ